METLRALKRSSPMPRRPTVMATLVSATSSATGPARRNACESCGTWDVPWSRAIATSRQGSILRWKGSTLSPRGPFINVGSAGWPRDGDWRVSYAIYDAGNQEVSIRRLEYDIQKARDKIKDAGLDG